MSVVLMAQCSREKEKMRSLSHAYDGDEEGGSKNGPQPCNQMRARFRYTQPRLILHSDISS